MRIHSLNKHLELFTRKKNLVLVTAAGFEERNLALLKILNSNGIKIKSSIICKYKDTKFNEPTGSEVTKLANDVSESSIEIDINQVGDCLKDYSNRKTFFIVDITGMTRVAIFNILYTLDTKSMEHNIIYTEAEKYFPDEEFWNDLKRDTQSKELIFTKYLEKEKAPIVYSYDSDILVDPNFLGNPEPGKPAMLIAFLTFKRSRLQIILQNYEFENKIFLLSEPVREDLKWRKEYLEMANYDLIQKNAHNVHEIETLYPDDVANLLDGIAYKNGECYEYNIMLAPLGSKMQTVGSYLFWKKHTEISIIFSQPRTYFKDSYTELYRETFILLN